MPLLDKVELLRKDELKIEKVFLDDENFVYVKEMTGKEYNDFQESSLEMKKDENGNPVPEMTFDNYGARLATFTVCDKNGNLLFEPEDHIRLGKNMSAKKLNKITNKAQEMNGLSGKEQDKLVKNSSADQSEDSTSA
jgi:hypothetical protein